MPPFFERDKHHFGSQGAAHAFFQRARIGAAAARMQRARLGLSGCWVIFQQAPHQLFGLAHRQAVLDDLAEQAVLHGAHR